MKKPKPPTNKEKLEVYETLLKDLAYHSCTTGNQAAVRELLQRINAWAFSHTCPHEERDDRINTAFWRLKDR